jgi:hypothetical protein
VLTRPATGPLTSNLLGRPFLVSPPTRHDRTRKRINPHEHSVKIQHKSLITNIFIKANFLARLLLNYTRKGHDQRGRSGYEEKIFMSVIDFIAVRRRQGDTRSEAAPISSDKSRATPAALTASQFTRHIAHIIEDEMRRSLKRHVEVIDPREMIDLAKLVAELKAKYIGTTLAIASNRQPITDSELEQLRGYRVKIQELEAAHNELNEAIASQLVEVRGVVKE